MQQVVSHISIHHINFETMAPALLWMEHVMGLEDIGINLTPQTSTNRTSGSIKNLSHMGPRIQVLQTMNWVPSSQVAKSPYLLMTIQEMVPSICYHSGRYYSSSGWNARNRWCLLLQKHYDFLPKTAESGIQEIEELMMSCDLESNRQF